MNKYMKNPILIDISKLNENTLEEALELRKRRLAKESFMPIIPETMEINADDVENWNAFEDKRGRVLNYNIETRKWRFENYKIKEGEYVGFNAETGMLIFENEVIKIINE